MKEFKQVTLKNFASFTDYIGEINNVQVDISKDLNVVMLFNLIEYTTGLKLREKYCFVKKKIIIFIFSIKPHSLKNVVLSRLTSLA